MTRISRRNPKSDVNAPSNDDTCYQTSHWIGTMHLIISVFKLTQRQTSCASNYFQLRKYTKEAVLWYSFERVTPEIFYKAKYHDLISLWI